MKWNDADADAFFRQGDEGTYTGGPGDSIPAGVVNVFDDIEDAALPRLTREQIERRDRYTRWVKGLVTTLAIGSGLAFGFRAVQNRGDAAASAPALQEAAPPIERRVTDFKAMTDTATEVAPRRPAPHAVEVPSDGRGAAEAVADTPAVPTKPVAQESAPAASTHAHAVRKTESSSSPKKFSEPPAHAKTTPQGVAAPTVPVHSSPPTANFPP